jgi:RNA polymerase sigma factor (sigma-70 family)
MGSDTAAAVTAVWRRESGHVIATLVRLTRDLDLAEDLAQEALVAALAQWPDEGIPASPGAWLVSVAKRRAIDHFRRGQTRRKLVEELGQVTADVDAPAFDEQVDRIEDDVLRLIYLTCHPALTPEARAALTLRMVCGLTTGEIARAFLVKEATIGQRISRAKRTLTEQRASVELPTGEERARRLSDVMAVIYLIFNEGYSATVGDDWMRPELCAEALRLARTLALLVPREPEVHGLQALLEIQASRTAARIDADGNPVLLEVQDRRRWDRLLIQRGFDALERARALDQPAGSTVLQAAIAATHARARRPEDTDWSASPSSTTSFPQRRPARSSRSTARFAHGRAFGPDAGLTILARSTPTPPWPPPTSFRGSRRPARARRQPRRSRGRVLRCRSADPQTPPSAPFCSPGQSTSATSPSKTPREAARTRNQKRPGSRSAHSTPRGSGRTHVVITPSVRSPTRRSSRGPCADSSSGGAAGAPPVPGRPQRGVLPRGRMDR